MPLHLLPRLCPLCQDKTIIGHGRRLRQAHDDGHDRIWVRRGICRTCGKTFTVLPNWLAPSGHFRVAHKPSNNHARCPYQVIEQTTGREIGWINEYLDYETLRRLADATLRTYAHELLHFLRWWEWKTDREAFSEGYDTLG